MSGHKTAQEIPSFAGFFGRLAVCCTDRPLPRHDTVVLSVVRNIRTRSWRVLGHHGAKRKSVCAPFGRRLHRDMAEYAAPGAALLGTLRAAESHRCYNHGLTERIT